MKLLGKKAIVTGANRRIGRGIAIAFAKEGADVLISYRSDEDGAKKTLELIGDRGKAIYADFSKNNGVETFFNEAISFLGNVDILVNNAAGYDTTPFLDLDMEVYQEVMNINAIAPVVLTQFVVKDMIKKKKSGNIINISSITGHRPFANRLAHSASKSALNMTTQIMALELAPYNIRVNGIAPGSTSESDKKDKNIPLKRYGKPEDHAQAAVWLASDDSSWMTGHIMVIDGGQSLI